MVHLVLTDETKGSTPSGQTINVLHRMLACVNLLLLLDSLANHDHDVVILNQHRDHYLTARVSPACVFRILTSSSCYFVFDLISPPASMKLRVFLLPDKQTILSFWVPVLFLYLPPLQNQTTSSYKISFMLENHMTPRL